MSAATPAARFVRRDIVPVTYDNLSRGFRALAQFGPFEQGDILDAPRLLEVFERYRPAAVMHFAALAYVGESVEKPLEYYRNNFDGALSLVAAMRKSGVDKLVFSSTCAIYGTAGRDADRRDVSAVADQSLWPLQIDGGTDAPGCSAAHGLRSVSLRYFNACGAHPSGEIGELHRPETHLIPRVLMAASGEIDAIHIFGTDYPTADGTAVRDYIHVCDLAGAHVAALRYLETAGETTALNLGTGRGYSVREILDSAGRVTGRAPVSRFAGRRAGDPPMLVADATAANRVLNFNTRRTEIDRIIASAWAWHRNTARRAIVATDS